MDADERERINRTPRDDLQGVHGPLAAALDDWLHAQHGAMSSAHAVGSFLADLADAGLQVVPAPAPVDAGDLASALRVPPPDAVMGALTARRTLTGDVLVEHVGGPLLSLSLRLFAQQHDGPRFITVRDGVVVVSGVDADGAPAELRYRAVGLQIADPQYLAVQEGGYLLLERLES